MAKSLDECYRDGEEAAENAVVVPRAMPEDGEYTVSLDAVVDTVFSNRDNVEGLLVRGVGKVLDGDLVGRRFVIFRGTSIDGSVAQIKAAIEMILGDFPGLKKGIDGMKNVLGTVIRVQVARSVGRDGHEYCNATMLGVIGDEVPATEESIPEEAAEPTANGTPVEAGDSA